MSTRITVLDHGFVELIETWGSDARIVEAARMSTNKGFQGWGPTWKCRFCGCLWRDNHDDTVSLFDAQQKSCAACEMHTPEACTAIPGDEKLLRYLYEHKHMSPFEMAGMTIDVQAPIFVFREWHRHRTQSYNELSARYTPLPDVNYVPSVDRLMQTSSTNKQAQGTGKKLSEREAENFRSCLHVAYHEAEQLYQEALGEGVPKELARLCIPVGRYSRMRASANLRNWLGFLTLRMDAAAQYEIRCYANVVGDLIAEAFPQTWKLFVEGVENA